MELRLLSSTAFARNGYTSSWCRARDVIALSYRRVLTPVVQRATEMKHRTYIRMRDRDVAYINLPLYPRRADGSVCRRYNAPF